MILLGGEYTPIEVLKYEQQKERIKRIIDAKLIDEPHPQKWEGSAVDKACKTIKQ